MCEVIGAIGSSVVLGVGETEDDQARKMMEAMQEVWGLPLGRGHSAHAGSREQGAEKLNSQQSVSCWVSKGGWGTWRRGEAETCRVALCWGAVGCRGVCLRGPCLLHQGRISWLACPGRPLGWGGGGGGGTGQQC